MVAACSGDSGNGGYGDDDDDDDDDDDAISEPAGLEGTTAAHNDVRDAHGVGPLTWSPALAATAQAWGDQCVDVVAPSGADLEEIEEAVREGHAAALRRRGL
jgi:uncharacterized protein YkwD